MRTDIIRSVSSGMKSLRLAVVLPLMLVGLAALGSSAVGVIGYLNAESGLDRASRAELATLAKARADLLADRLRKVTGDLDSLATSAGAQIALSDMANIFTLLTVDIPIARTFFAPQGSTAADRAALSGAGSKTMYGFRHEAMHGSFASLWRNAGYGEIYIVDTAGNVAYTVTKSADFLLTPAEGGITGGLAEAVSLAASAPMGQPVVSGFGPYDYAGGVPAVFVAQAIPSATAADTAGGFVVIRLDVGFFDQALGAHDGLGETGQTYLVDAEGLILSNKPLAPEPTSLAETIGDPRVIAAVAAGENSESRFTNGRGIEVIAAVAPLEFLGAKWAIVGERSVAESFASVDAMRVSMLLGTLAVVLVATLVGVLFARTVTRPITRLTRTMKGIAEGDYDVTVEGADRTNEVGQMARAVEVFRQNGLKIAEMTEGERTASEQRLVERARMMQELQSAFGEVVDAASAGDFSKRVEASFPEEELNRLAASVNQLVETVDRGISETGEVLAALAETDLTRRVEGYYEGAFKRLKMDTNGVAERLSEIVMQLRETSRALKTATGEILSGANDLSERTTKQAATIEETSAAMEQLAATVLQNAQRAKDASVAAAGVTGTAEEGGEVMHRANEAMEQITASSAKISNIIGLIDDIAFQTNLLALNASVEAARAGEAGKGFAVVAVEVRRLAQSAAQASSEVKALIEQSATEVKGGSKLVAEAAEKLQAILAAARSSNELMNSIAKQSQEQAAAIEEVNASVRQLDEMTQHNAALVEETNAAIEQTEAQALELDRVVETFTVGQIEARGERRRGERDGAAPLRAVDAKRGPARVARKAYPIDGNAAVDEDWAEF